jgi:hypothetical protein
MELEELNKPYGMPILYKPFLITENYNPAILDTVVQASQGPEQTLTPPMPSTGHYTIKNPDPAFKHLIESLLR